MGYLGNLESGTYTLDPLAYSGMWGYQGGSLYSNVSGNTTWVADETGIIGGRDAPWLHASSELVAMGGYSASDDSYLFNTIIEASAPNDPSSGLSGYSAGHWELVSLDSADSFNFGTIAGDAVAIYMDGNTGNTGYLESGIAGFYYPDLNMWSVLGTWSRRYKETVDLPANYSLSTGSLYNTMLSGRFDNAGESFIHGAQYMGETRYFSDGMNSLAWGIYDLKLGSSNTYYGRPADASMEPADATFSATAGGYGIFGMSDRGSLMGPWVAGVSGNWPADGKITGTLSGHYMTNLLIGDIGGPYTGENQTGIDGDWIGQSIGIYESSAMLAWSAGGYGGYHYHDGSSINQQGSFAGNLGTLSSPFTNATAVDTPGSAVELYMLGTAWPDGYGTWWGHITGSFADDSDIPLDGVSGGFIGGRTTFNYLFSNYLPEKELHEGMLVSLYVNGDDAGILEGDFTGAFYPLSMDNGYSGMYDVNGGTIRATKKATGYGSAMSYEVNTEDIRGTYHGNFFSGGSIVGELYRDSDGINSTSGYLDSKRAWLAKDGTAEDWGVLDIELGGYYEGTPSSDWSLNLGGRWEGWQSMFWVAQADGTDWSGTGGETRIAGTFSDGKYMTPYEMGVVEADLLGTFDTNTAGLWEAIALGSYEKTDSLAWSAIGYGGYHYYDGWSLSQDYSVEGLLGTTVSPFANTASLDVPGTAVDLYLMGQVRFGGYGAWWGGISESKAGTSVIPAPISKYGGFIAGRTGFTYAFADYLTDQEFLEGMLVSLYVNDNEAGILEGDFSGTYYPLRDNMGILDATNSGTLTATSKELNVGASYTTEYYHMLGHFEGNFATDGWIGSKNGIGQTTGYLGSYAVWLEKTGTLTERLPWGIFNMELGGHYDGIPSSDWTIEAGGIDWRAPGGIWMVTIDGIDWSGSEGLQRIEGDIIEGTYLTYDALGTIDGRLLGTFDVTDPGLWESVVLGTFEETPLYLSGMAMGVNWNALDMMYTYNGPIHGAMGTPIDDPTALTFMGNHLAHTPFWSINIDGGIDQDTFFISLLDFRSSENILDGRGVGIYHNENTGFGGYLTYSDVTGSFHDRISMWDAEGTVAQSTPVNTVANFNSFIRAPIAMTEIDIDGTFLGETNGETIQIEGEDWGIFRMLAGGFHGNEDDGYWLAPAVGEFDAAGYLGFMDLYYLTESVMGRVSGSIFTSGDPVNDSMTSWSLAADFSGERNLDFFAHWGTNSLYQYGTWVGDDYGIIGAVQTQNNEYDLLAMGEYYDQYYGINSANAYVWTTEIYDTYDTTSNLIGFTGGVWHLGEMHGKASTLFNPGGAGILLADLGGNYYETWYDFSTGYGGAWIAMGPAQYVEMTASAPSATIYTDYASYTGGGAGHQGGTINVTAANAFSTSYADQDWGVWGSSLHGSYTGTPFAEWSVYLQAGGTELEWLEAAGHEMAENVIVGRATGAWVDLEYAMTGISAGELVGTFDPTNWQVVAGGSWIETARFLGMAAVDASGKPINPVEFEKLKQLNVPLIEIGRTTLAQSAGTVNNLQNVQMNDVTFFSYKTGNDPRIWATEGVGGEFVGTPAIVGETGFASVPLSNGNGLNANFDVQKWDNISTPQTWAATVDGGGTLNDTTIWMQGGAAGQIGVDVNGNTDPDGFGGTGAGVAGPGQTNPFTQP
ncbi:hypothetical protein ACFL9U_12410 [Thermodesulfobacteriota bacterium]